MIKCTVCDQMFYSIVDCTSHVERTHADPDQDPCIRVQYRCNICGRVFGHRADVRNHTLREHGLQRVSMSEEPA